MMSLSSHLKYNQEKTKKVESESCAEVESQLTSYKTNSLAADGVSL